MKKLLLAGLCGAALCGASYAAVLGVQQFTVSAVRSAVENSGATVKDVTYSMFGDGLVLTGLHGTCSSGGQDVTFDVSKAGLQPRPAFLAKLAGFGITPGTMSEITGTAHAEGVRASTKEGTCSVDSVDLTGGLSVSDGFLEKALSGSSESPLPGDIAYGRITASGLRADAPAEHASLTVRNCSMEGWDGSVLHEATFQGLEMLANGKREAGIASVSIRGARTLPEELGKRAAAYDPKKDATGREALALMKDLFLQDRPLFTGLTMSGITAEGPQAAAMDSLAFDWPSSKPWNSTISAHFTAPLTGDLKEVGALLPSMKSVEAGLSLTVSQAADGRIRTAARASLPGLCVADADITATYPAVKDMALGLQALAGLVLHAGSAGITDEGLVSRLADGAVGDAGRLEPFMKEIEKDVVSALGRNGLSEGIIAFLRRPGKITLSPRRTPLSGADMALGLFSPSSILKIETVPGSMTLEEQVRALGAARAR